MRCSEKAAPNNMRLGTTHMSEMGTDPDPEAMRLLL